MPWPDPPSPHGSFESGKPETWWTSVPQSWIDHNRASWQPGQGTSFAAGLPSVDDATSYYAVRQYGGSPEFGNALWATIKATAGFLIAYWEKAPDGTEYYGPCWLTLGQAGSLEAAYDLTSALVAAIAVASVDGFGNWKRNIYNDAVNEQTAAAQMGATYVANNPSSVGDPQESPYSSSSGWDHMTHALGGSMPDAAQTYRNQADAIRGAVN